MKNTFAKTLALNKFLNSIDDVILREEILEQLKEIGRQGSASEDDLKKVKELLSRANVSYEDFEKLVKQFRR